MLIETKYLHGSKIHALDGQIGTIDEILFDDRGWTLRYLIVTTSAWPFEHKVLIPPASVGLPNWDERSVTINLTCEQIKNSPDVNTDMPVSRQWETDFHNYYSLPYYWGAMADWEQSWYQEAMPGHTDLDDTHLRSTKAITGYVVSALNGDVGHVKDFIIDEASWQIRYLAVFIRHWWPAKIVLLPLDLIHDINWQSNTIAIRCTRDQVKNTPEWDTQESITCELEEALYEYFTKHSDVALEVLTSIRDRRVQSPIPESPSHSSFGRSLPT